jgi:hypothetical protein
LDATELGEHNNNDPVDFLKTPSTIPGFISTRKISPCRSQQNFADEFVLFAATFFLQVSFLKNRHIRTVVLP